MSVTQGRGGAFIMFMYPYDVQGKGQWDLYFGNREKYGNYSIIVEYILIL